MLLKFHALFKTIFVQLIHDQFIFVADGWSLTRRLVLLHRFEFARTAKFFLMTALRIKLFPFAFRVHITSSKQRPDRFPPGVYATALFKINIALDACCNFFYFASDSKHTCKVCIRRVVIKVERRFVVGVSFLEWEGRHSNILLCIFVISCFHLGFIDDVVYFAHPV